MSGIFRRASAALAPFCVGGARPLQRRLASSGQAPFSAETGNLACVLDTLALAKRIEVDGGTTKKVAEAIASAIAAESNKSIHTAAQSFISKMDMQEIDHKLDDEFSKFMFETKIKEEHNFSQCQDLIRMLQCDIESTRAELLKEVNTLKSTSNASTARLKFDFARYFLGTLVTVVLPGIGYMWYTDGYKQKVFSFSAEEEKVKGAKEENEKETK